MGFLDSLGGFLSGAAEGGQKGLGMVMDIKRQQQEERDAKMRQRYYDSQVAQGAAEGTERTRANKELERLRQLEYELSVRQADAKTDEELKAIQHEQEILDYKKRELASIGTINSMKGGGRNPLSNMNPEELAMLSAAYQRGDPLVRAYLDSVAPDMVKQMKSNPLWNAEQSKEGVYNITPGNSEPGVGTPSSDAGNPPGIFMKNIGSVSRRLATDAGSALSGIFGEPPDKEALSSGRANIFRNQYNPRDIIPQTPRMYENPLTMSKGAMGKLSDVLFMSGEYETPAIRQLRDRFGVYPKNNTEPGVDFSELMEGLGGKYRRR